MVRLELQHGYAAIERARLIARNANMESDMVDELEVVCEMLNDLLKGEDLNGSWGRVDRYENPGKISIVFWTVFLVSPVFTGILRYQFLPHEFADRGDTVRTRHWACKDNGGGAPDGPCDWIEDTWQNNETGKIYSRDMFREHRQWEAFREFYTAFLYGLIGCGFYVFQKAQDGDVKIVKNLKQALGVDFVVAVFFGLSATATPP